MTSWKALVAPRLGTTDFPGMCLRFAQSFFGAPLAHRSAWHAWLATQRKHAPSDPLPGVPVLLWFEHWGNYNDGLGPYDGRPVGARGNWGHVAIHVPGDAIYTSPLTGSARGSQRYANIGQMASIMNLAYVGWSEDINGLRVAEPASAPAPLNPARKDRDMLLTWDTNGTGYLVTANGTHGLASGQVYNLFYRLINSDQTRSPFWEQVKNFFSGGKVAKPEVFNPAEMGIIDANLKIVAASVKAGISIDIEKTASALSDALGKKFNPDIEIDENELAAAFEKVAPRITAAMVKQAGLAMSK